MDEANESAIKVFYSYVEEDEALQKELEKHLTILARLGNITTWDKRKLLAGTTWAQEVDFHIKTAQIILLLISPDFMASEYCFSTEVHTALERHKKQEATVVPIILRPVNWQDSEFGNLQPLPSKGKPVTSWPRRHGQDQAFLDITLGIKALAESIKLQKKRTPANKLWSEQKNALRELDTTSPGLPEREIAS